MESINVCGSNATVIPKMSLLVLKNALMVWWICLSETSPVDTTDASESALDETVLNVVSILRTVEDVFVLARSLT